jgi:TPR repeat protein
LARFLLDRGKSSEAAEWYRRSAAAAPADFCRDLAAYLVATGRRDLQAVARDALRRAAESDEPGDLFAYGTELAQGRGGPVDNKQAKFWLGRAQAKGFPGALALLDRVSESATSI